MRIAVIGAEASGKTSLAHRLAQAASLPLVGDPRMEVLDQTGYQTLFEWSAAGGDLRALMQRQAGRELRIADAIVDNGVIDLFCFFQRWYWNRLSPDAVEPCWNLVREASTRYDHIFLTPPRIVAGFASHRFRDPLNAIQTMRLIDALANEVGFGNRLHRLPAGDEASVGAAAVAVLG